MVKTKERIWEIDALRGLFILFVVAIHLIYDLEYIFDYKLNLPDAYYFIQENGAILFILISGISITLGSKHIKRGLILLGIALVITIISLLFQEGSTPILFGILHLLAFAMLTYPLYKKMPNQLLIRFAIIIFALGLFLINIDYKNSYFLAIGLKEKKFIMGDYFPIFPNLSFFLLGIVIGRVVYHEKKTLMPNFPYKNPIIAFFSFLGRNSLLVYLLHQPIILLILFLIFKN